MASIKKITRITERPEPIEVPRLTPREVPLPTEVPVMVPVRQTPQPIQQTRVL